MIDRILKLPVASGDTTLLALIAGVLLLAGAAFGTAIAGGIMTFRGSEERRRLGKRLLLSSLIPIAAGAILWTAYVGLD